MRYSRLVLVGGLLVAGVAARPALAVPSINYPSFAVNAPFTMNGGAPGVAFGTLLRTTNSNQTRAIVVNASQDLTQSYSVQYSFWMGAGNYNTYSPGTAAGGLAFVIQGDPRTTTALGGASSQLGYGDPTLTQGNCMCFISSTRDDL